MGVGRTLDAEFVRVHTHLFLEPEPPEQSSTYVVGGVGDRGDSTEEEGKQLEVCELVLRRQERMGVG